MHSRLTRRTLRELPHRWIRARSDLSCRYRRVRPDHPIRAGSHLSRRSKTCVFSLHYCHSTLLDLLGPVEQPSGVFFKGETFITGRPVTPTRSDPATYPSISRASHNMFTTQPVRGHVTPLSVHAGGSPLVLLNSFPIFLLRAHRATIHTAAAHSCPRTTAASCLSSHCCEPP